MKRWKRKKGRMKKMMPVFNDTHNFQSDSIFINETRGYVNFMQGYLSKDSEVIINFRIKNSE
jgi:hypothetical protein